MLPPYVIQENHALYRPLARHPLAVLRRHTFRSTDTTLVGPWLCCRKVLVHLSLLRCLPPRVMSSGRSLQTCCSVLLRPSLAPLERAATSLALFLPPLSALLHLSSIDPRRPTRPRTPFLLKEPFTWGRSAAAGFRLRHARAETNLLFLRTDRQIILHDVPVVFYETRDRFRATDERMADAADERYKFRCEFMHASVCCALARLQGAAQVCDWDGATSERGGACWALTCQEYVMRNSFGAMRLSHRLHYVRMTCVCH